MDLTLTYWAVASVLAHDLFAWATWACGPGRPLAASLGAWVERWRRAGPAGREAGRFLFYVGIPYLAVVLGVVSPGALGLLGGPARPGASATPAGPLTLVGGLLALDWVRSLGLGSLLALGAFAALALVWWRYQRLVGKLPTRSWHFLPRQNPNGTLPATRWPLSAPLAAVQQPWGWAWLLLDAVYLQTHWAFYRAWTLDLLHDDPAGPALGTLLGLVLVGLEWYSDVGLRERLRTQAGVEEWIFVASLALVSTFVFLFIGNLWMLVVVHWLIAWGLLAFLGWLRRRSPRVRGT